MHLSVDIIDTATKKVLEHSDFYGDDAQAQFVAWKTLREKDEEFGESVAKNIIVTDVTSRDDQQKKLLTRDQVIKGCWEVIKMIGVANTDAKTTDEQMDAFFETPLMQQIILALVVGSPKAALRKIQKTGTDLYPQAFVDQITAALTALIIE